MTKEELINNIAFRQKCGQYGLDWENFSIYYMDDNEPVIMLSTPNPYVDVFFDKNFNTIEIYERKICERFEDDETIAKSRYFMCNYPYFYDEQSGYEYIYPFEGFSLKNFIDISSRIEIIESNQGHAIDTKINNKWLDRNSDDDYTLLLSYIKFIGEEIKNFNIYYYHMKMMEIETQDVFLYVKKLLRNINICIEECVEQNKRPKPCDILRYLGQNYRELNFDGMLYDVIKLLLRQKGIRPTPGTYNKIEPIKDFKKSDLSIIAKETLDILKTSDEELKENKTRTKTLK